MFINSPLLCKLLEIFDLSLILDCTEFENNVNKLNVPYDKWSAHFYKEARRGHREKCEISASYKNSKSLLNLKNCTELHNSGQSQRRPHVLQIPEC
jgi:hypothetical protein